MGHVLFCVLGLFLLNPVFYCEPIKEATLNLEPNRSMFLPKENVSLLCDIDRANETDWIFTFSRNGEQFQSCSTNKKSCLLKMEKNSSGQYQCVGSYKNLTIKSKNVNITVLDKPTLVVSPSWLSPGASVNLTCKVTDPSPAWRFFWFEAVFSQSKSLYNYTLLPNGETNSSSMIHKPNHTAAYACKVGRRKPLVKSARSPPQLVWSLVSHPSSPSIRVVPSRGQRRVSLQCEGNSSRWRVMRFTESQHLSNCSGWGTMTGSTCWVNQGTRKPAVYWCETGSGLFSNAINVTIQLSKPEGPSFSVPLVVSLVCVILLFPSLLLLYHCIKRRDGKKSHDVVWIDPKATENTEDSLVYVQVHIHSKGKRQPAKMEEIIYSEVKI